MRALFVDLDGAPLQPVIQSTRKPHIVVESSPGKFHAYWLVSDVALDQFEGLQKALAARFGGDPQVNDLPRVLRLPGFFHRKGEPYKSRIVHLRYRASAYQVADFDQPEMKANGHADVTDSFARFNLPDVEEVAAAMRAIPNNDQVDRAQWIAVGHALKAACPSNEGLELFKEWSTRWTGGKYNKEHTVTAWEGFEPNRTGVAKLYKLANEADPNWRGEVGSKEPTSKKKLMQPSAEFVAGFVPPDYLVEGLLQRRYVYSFTAPTGSGKTAIALRIAAHVALGLPLADKVVERGRVLFFAGENPDDVRSRWIKLCEEMKQDADTLDVVFLPFTLDLTKNRKHIDEEAAEHGPFSLLIVDTSASYYTGNDENDNVALGNHARMLRTFVELPGAPCILVTCHPTKTPNMDNLLPRGGGAFLAEVDGNLVAKYDQGTRVAEVTTHGKFRGPEFAPFSFKLVAGKSEKLVDSKGRSIWSVFARPISDLEMEATEAIGHSDEDDVLRTMQEKPGLSVRELAEHLLWNTMDGKPNKTKVYRVLTQLTKAKLVEKRRDGHYVLTTKGTTEAEKLSPSRVGARKRADRPKKTPNNPRT